MPPKTIASNQELTVHKLGADLVSVSELLEEACVLGDTLHAERLVVAAEGVDEVVVRDRLLLNLALDVRVVNEGDRLRVRVDLARLSLDDVNGALHVPGDESGRLDDGPGLEGSDGNRGEERRVKEVVVRGDDGLGEQEIERERITGKACQELGWASRLPSRASRRQQRDARRCTPRCRKP